MVIRILRTLMLDEAYGPGGLVCRRVPVFAGQRLHVDPVFDECEDYDWLQVVGGNLLPLPPDAWKVDTALMN